MENLKSVWQYLVMIILAICLTFSVHSCNSEKAAKESEIANRDIQKTVDKIEQGRPDIIYREKEVYPKVDKRIDDIKGQIQQNTERSKDEVKKANIDDIARKFTMLGYSSSVSR